MQWVSFVCWVVAHLLFPKDLLSASYCTSTLLRYDEYQIAVYGTW
jgi:hypothetical protein